MALSEFYHSKEWEKLLSVLKMERVDGSGNLICQHCGQPILKKYDAIGHHVQPLTEENYKDASISLNPDNIIFVHHRCHNKIHDKGFGQYSERQVFLVHGSACSGKTSFVKSVMNDGDLILDIDNIWECVSGLPRYIKPNGLKNIVFNIRDSILNSIMMRNGLWKNAYIIGMYPFENERMQILKKYGAREIHIDTSEDECIARLMNSNDGRDTNEWLGFIDDYWSKARGEW